MYRVARFDRARDVFSAVSCAYENERDAREAAAAHAQSAPGVTFHIIRVVTAFVADGVREIDPAAPQPADSVSYDGKVFSVSTR